VLVRTFIGKPQTFANCWGWHNHESTPTPCTGYLVRFTFPMVQAVEGCKVNNLAQKSECPIAVGHYANQSTNDLDYPPSERRSKVESTLRALLALAGHSVHPLRDGGYLVAKWGYTYQADDIADLKAFAARLGVCHG
jgi:hypothetical protein